MGNGSTATLPTITPRRPRAKNGAKAAALAQQLQGTPPGGVLLTSNYVLSLPSAGGYVSIPAIGAYDFGTADFSIETWCNSTQGGPLLALAGTSGAILSIQVAANGEILVLEGSTTALRIGQPATTLDGSWHHVALTRASNTLTLYLDGIKQASAAESAPFNIAGVTAFLLGAATTAPNAPSFIGNYTDVRLWNVARSQAAIRQTMFYRLPADTTAIGYWTFSTQTLNDSSINKNNGGSLQGGATFVFMPIYFGPQINALVFTGDAPSVSIAGNNAYNLGAGDFTLQAWIMPASAGVLISRTANTGGASAAGFTLSCDATGRLSFSTCDGTHTTTAAQQSLDGVSLNRWQHVAVVRQASAITLYQDGIPVASAIENTPVSIDVPLTAALQLGHTDSTVHAAQPLLAQSVAAPPLPAGKQPFGLGVAELSLWQSALSQDQIYRGMLIQLHGSESNLIGYWNFSTQNVVDLSPTANLSVAPYGAATTPAPLPIVLAQYVVSLPGSTGGYLAIPSQSAYNFGTDDFTIEARFKATAAGTLIARAYDPGQPSCGLQVRIAASAVTLTLGTPAQSSTFSGSAALLDGQWHHIAWTRASGTMQLFIDEQFVSVSPATSTDNVSSTENLIFGAVYDPVAQSYSDFLTGSIDFVYLWNQSRALAELQAASYVPIDFRQSVGAWTFDQLAPIDSSRTGANGVLGSAASIVADLALPSTISLSALHLGGTGSYVDCSARTDLSFGGTQPYTIGAWVKPMMANATGSIVSRYDAAGASEYRLRLVNGVPVAERSSSTAGVTGVTQLQPNFWYFVSMTYDGHSLSVAVNGISENAAASGAIVAATPTHVLIGASASGTSTTDNLMACIQSAAVWTSALTTAQLQTEMNATLTGTETGLQALFNFVYASSQDWTGHGPAAVLQNVRYQSTNRWQQKFRNAMALDGNGSYVNCGGGRSLNIKGPMTLEGWIRITNFSTAWQPIVAKGSVYQIRRYQSTNQITFSTPSLAPSGAQELPSNPNLNLLDGRWHHVAAVYDGQKKSLYVDGQLNASIAATGDISVGNGVLYVADNDGEVMVVDQETGNEIWTARVFKPIKTSPVTDKNVMCVSSPSGDIFAFDYSTRQRLWDTQIPPGYQVPMKIHDDVIYFSGAGTAISAVDLQTGRILWNMNGLANDAAPTIDGRNAYYCNSSTIFCRDLISGTVRWAYSLPDQTIGAPALLDNVLFVNCADNNVYAVVLGAVTSLGGSFEASAQLIGSPVVENGTIYVVTTDGTTTALSWSSTYRAFTTVWSAKIAAGVSQPLVADFPYAAVAGNDNTIYVYNAQTGAVAWQYSKQGQGGALAISGLTLVNGAAYFSTADGFYNAVDVENKAILWSKDLQTVASASAVVTYAPFCIGASVDEQGNVDNGTFCGLIAEVRLWQEARSADDIAATWRRAIVGDEPQLAGYWACAGLGTAQENDLSAHLNPGVYTGNVLSSAVDLVVQDPLPRILAQAQMMQQWTPADAAAGNTDGQVAFRTEISLLDGTGSALVAKGIRVFTDAPATITIAGVNYQTDNEHAAEVMTDMRGMISVITPCNELTSPAVQIWSDFMRADERVVIHPDDNLRSTLGSIQGSDLIDPAQSTNPLLAGKPPLLTNVSAEQADGLASAINNAIQNVKRPDTAPSRYAAVVRPLALGTSSVAGDAVSQGVVLTGGQPYAQYVGPGAIPNWQFNFSTYQFSPLSTEQVHAMRAARAARPVLTAEAEGFWDLWDDFVNGVKQAANVVIEFIDDAVQIVVHWVDSAVQTLQHVFQSIAEVGQAIYGIFKQLLTDIVDAAKKIYEFFAFLFSWGDILNTKNVIVSTLQQSMSRAGSLIDEFIANEQAFFDGLESTVDNAFETVIGRIGKLSMGQIRGSAPTENPLLPSGPSLFGGTGSTMRLAQDAKASFGTEGNFVLSTAFENSGGITGGSLVAYSNDAIGMLEQAFDSIEDMIANSKAVAAFETAYQYFAQVGSNPESFLQLIVQGLLEAMKGVVELTIEIAKAVVTLLLQAVKAFINSMISSLSAPIDIPVVSWLYEQISGSSLSMLDFVALIVAVPATIIYKAATGTAPFKQTLAAPAVPARLAATAKLTDWQKALKVCQAVTQILNIVVAIPIDLQEVQQWNAGAAVGPAGPGQTITFTRVAWAGRLGDLFRAVNFSGGFATFMRWTNFAMKAIITGLGAPWIYNSSPTEVENDIWVFYLVELLTLQLGLAIYTQVTAMAWGFGALSWAIPTMIGCARFVATLAVVVTETGDLPSTGTLVSAFFAPIPDACKWLRSQTLVQASRGISLIVLALVDLLCGLVPPICTLATVFD